MTDTEKLREIVSLLPGKNCGKCGYENCGEFAVALVEGKAKPAECRKSLSKVKEICLALGIEAPSEQELKEMGRGHGHHHHVHHGHDGHHGHGRHPHSLGHHSHPSNP